jgi:hypothetical protein
MSFSPSSIVVEPKRLHLLIELARRGGQARSPDLRASVGINSGPALIVHKRRLVKAGLIDYVGPQISLTLAGRKALASMASAIQNALEATAP